MSRCGRGLWLQCLLVFVVGGVAVLLAALWWFGMAPFCAKAALAKSVDLGEIAAEEFYAEVLVRNEGWSRLEILSARGDCGCFEGLVGKRSIEAGKSERLLLKFRAGAGSFMANRFSSRVVLQTNERGRGLVEVNVLGEFGKMRGPRLYPAELDFGRVPIENGRMLCGRLLVLNATNALWVEANGVAGNVTFVTQMRDVGLASLADRGVSEVGLASEVLGGSGEFRSVVLLRDAAQANRVISTAIVKGILVN